VAVIVDRHESVLVITLNRPEARNALDVETMAHAGRELEAAERDPGIAVVVLTGAGDKAFSAGMDLKSFAEGGVTADDPAVAAFRRLTVGEFTKPTIAAVNGAAVAGGFELMLACDLVVAANHAMFGLSEVTRGLVALGGGVLLPLRIPLTIALELGMTGDRIDARRAYELGLVNRVVPAAQVLDEAIALGSRIAENAPLAVAVTRRLMHDNARLGGAEAFARCDAAAAGVMASHDAREGAMAFAEKRKPVWKGE
jgi:enoyl-CoA hydratase